MNFYDEMNDSQTNSSDDDVIEDMNIMLEINPIKKEKLRKIKKEQVAKPAPSFLSVKDR